MTTHEPSIVDEQDHEDQHDRKQQTLEVLRREDHREEIEARDQHDEGAERQDHRVDAEEDGCIPEPLSDPGLPAEGLTDHECGADRHDRGGKHGRPE